MKSGAPVVVLLLLIAQCRLPPEESPPPSGSPALTSIAVRVHRMEAMEAFYSEAFGFRFQDVKTGDITSRFGRLGGIEMRLVPLREEVDFESYRTLQMGFEVPDVERVIQLALEHGGTKPWEVERTASGLHGAIRDPDGNTVEILQRY